MVNKKFEITPKFYTILYYQKIVNNDIVHSRILNKVILKMYHNSMIRRQLSETDGIKFVSGIKFNEND